MNTKETARRKRHFRIRNRVHGTAQKPRMNVYRSNKDIYVQLIDDDAANTLVFASSRQKDIAAQSGTKSEISKLVGDAAARRALELGIKEVVFDRGGYLYHGRVKALAEGAREAGLQF